MPRKIRIDEIDRTIIKSLSGDGRIRKANLAARLGMSASATAARITRLESDGVLQGYTAIVSGASGISEYMVRIQIWPERPAQRLNFEHALRALDVVVSAKRLVGLGDYLLRGIGPNYVDAVWELAGAQRRQNKGADQRSDRHGDKAVAGHAIERHLAGV